MTRKKISIFLSIGFAISFVYFFNIVFYSVKAAPSQSVTQSQVYGWGKPTSNNVQITQEGDMARILETKKSEGSSNIDMIVNINSFDISKVVEFNIKVDSFPSPGDRHLDIFLSRSYTETLLHLHLPKDAMGLHINPNDSGTHIGARYWMQTGTHGVGNTTATHPSTWGKLIEYDGNLNIKIIVLDSMTVVLFNDIEYMHATEFPKSWYTNDEMFLSMRYHHALSNTSTDFWDVSLSQVKNEEDIDLYAVKDYETDNISAEENPDGSISLINEAALGSLYYVTNLNTTQKITIRYKFDSIPGYHDNGTDAWFAICLSNQKNVSPLKTIKYYGVLIRPKNQTQLGYDLPAGSSVSNLTSDYAAEGYNEIVFEKQKTRIKMTLNGVEHTELITENFFQNNNGYLSFVLYNNKYSQGNDFNITYEIENEGEIIMPAVQVANEDLTYDLASNSDFTLYFEDDFVISMQGNSITQSDYNLSQITNSLTINREYMVILDTEQTYDFTIIAEQSQTVVSIIITGEIIQISTNARNYIFDKGSPNDLIIQIRGSDIFSSISGQSINASRYQFNEDILTIKKEYLSQLTNGEKSFTVYGMQSYINITVFVKGQTVIPLGIVLQNNTFAFDNKNKADINISILGGVPVRLTGNAVTADDYEIIITDLVIYKSYLENLNNGEYTFKVLSEDDIYDTFIVTVLNKIFEGNNDNNDNIPEPQQDISIIIITLISVSGLSACITVISLVLFFIKRKKLNT